MGTRITNWASRYWKRKTDQPDYRQAYVKLPLDTELPPLAVEFERVCEGRLDRVPRRDSLVIDTDFVSEERFDAERFDELVAELKARAPPALHPSRFDQVATARRWHGQDAHRGTGETAVLRGGR